MSTTITKSKSQHGELPATELTRGGRTYSPRIDIWETGEQLVLEADLPGVRPEDLDIQFENRELRIHGKVAPRHEDVRYLWTEYGMGDFYRTFAVGEAIDARKISAELKDGVLTLRLPKTEAVRPRRIEVQSG